MRMSSNNLAATAASNAPLPSPSAVKSAQLHMPKAPTTIPQQQTQQQQQIAKTAPAGSNTADPYLKDFNLVAEAAKRAQMAVVMRDLNDFNL